MIHRTPDRARLVSTVARVASFIAIASLFTGCISIPQRAWANGRAMSDSRAYQRALAGDMSFSTHRELQDVVNFGALGFYREAPAFSPFPKAGTWQY